MSDTIPLSNTEELKGIKDQLEQFAHNIHKGNLYSPSAEMDAEIHKLATMMMSDRDTYADTLATERAIKELQDLRGHAHGLHTLAYHCISTRFVTDRIATLQSTLTQKQGDT